MAAAIAWKVFVHLGADALLIVSATLAALGATVCRERRLAPMFLMWAAIIRAFWPAGGLAFVELDVAPPAGKEEIHVSVAGR